MLRDEGYPATANCLLLTGKGYPDVATRRMLSRLSEELRLPAYALMDGDPHGADIARTYRFGSAGMAHDRERLAAPHLRWLGLFSARADSAYLDRVGVPECARLPLLARDRAKTAALLADPVVPPEWKERLREALETGVRARALSISIGRAIVHKGGECIRPRAPSKIN